MPATARIQTVSLLALGVLLVGLLAVTPTATATDTLNETEKLIASDGADGDFFGDSVSVDGDTAIVGAVGDDNANGLSAGAAYVYVLDSNGNWNEQTKLIGSVGSAAEEFGESVSLDGDTAVVGDGEDIAYIYVRDSNGNWNEEINLTASDGSPSDFFSSSVSLDGDTMIAGAHFDDNANGEDAGAAYVFVRDGNGNWNEQAKLTASDGDPDDKLGVSVSLDGDTAIAGAHFDDNANGDNAGGAYVFVRDGNGNWTEQAKLTASDGEDGDRFGRSVSLDGDTAIAGANFGDNANANDAGAAYVYDRDANDNWNEQAKLTASDGTGGDRFGRSVGLHGDTAIAGADQAHHADGNEAGAAYVYDRDADENWNEQAKLTASDGGDGDDFGWTVDLDGDTVITGARDNDNVNGLEAGAAYTFHSRPFDLRATATAQAGALELDWDAFTFYPSPIYHVKRSTSSGGPYTEIATTTEPAYTDTGLGDQTYYYVVTTENETGAESEPSNEASAHPRPPAPENLDAVQGGANTIHLDWDEPAGVSGTVTYRLFRSTQDGGPYERVARTSGTQYTDESPHEGTNYYVVTLVDDQGVESPDSDQASAEPGGAGQPSSDPDDGQNDAGSGGDASDDPDDPTILAGGELIRINGTLIPVLDPVDAYGTEISPNATLSMRFHFNVPATMGLELTLLDPDGNEHDSAQAPLDGGEIEVEAVADDGEHLQPGTWVTVLEHGLSLQPDATEGSPWQPPALAVDPMAPAPAIPASTDTGLTEVRADGVVPTQVPNQFTLIDYRDKRPCDPRC